METLENFVQRFSRSVGCYYKKNKSSCSLLKYDSHYRNHMGVFGWVSERTTMGLFVVSTYEYLVDAQAIAEADGRRPGAHFVSKRNDRQGNATGLSYRVRRDSRGDDYDEAVRALKLACGNR